MGEVKNTTDLMANLNSRTEKDGVKSEPEKDGDSEISLSSNDDFEIIGGKTRKPGQVASGGDYDEKPSGVFNQLFKNTTVKRRRIISTLASNMSEKRPIVPSALARKKQHVDEDAVSCRDKPAVTVAATADNSQEEQRGEEHRDEYSSTLWKALFIMIAGLMAFQLAVCAHLFVHESKVHMFDRNEELREETLEETIARQQRMIEKLENELKNCARLDVYSLPVRVEEDRAIAFKRRTGFSYHFIIVDWKKDDQGTAQQHLHLAFKQSNASIYVYDHGPSSGKHFAVGDRIIDVDGKAFSRAIEVRDQILWSHHNKDHFTSIIERPSTEHAMRTVSSLLQPAMSSFSVVLST